MSGVERTGADAGDLESARGGRGMQSRWPLIALGGLTGAGFSYMAMALIGEPSQEAASSAGTTAQAQLETACSALADVQADRSISRLADIERLCDRPESSFLLPEETLTACDNTSAGCTLRGDEEVVILSRL